MYTSLLQNLDIQMSCCQVDFIPGQLFYACAYFNLHHSIAHGCCCLCMPCQCSSSLVRETPISSKECLPADRSSICFPICCPTYWSTCWLIAFLLIGMVVSVTADCHADLQERREMAGGASSGTPHLYHTMSALVSQRQTNPRPQAPGMHVRANLEIVKSPAGPGHIGSPPRLTEALLASAAAEVRSSAEKLPVSHRLPVSRSVFDSDEGESMWFYT